MSDNKPPVVLPPLRDHMEIQRAHDMLVQALLSELIEQGSAMHAAQDVLCWVLKHDHNIAFAGNLTLFEEALKASGFTIRKADKPFIVEPPEDGTQV